MAARTPLVPVSDITLDGAGKERFTQAELKQMYDLGLSFSDTETTGLDRKRHALTEFASTKAVKETDGHGHDVYRLKLFNAFITPFKPLYQEYLDEKPAAQTVAYDRKRYEYDIDLKALEITGSKLLREKPSGPITGLTVGGHPVRPHAFYDVADEIMQFIAPHDMYFNAPFDKPFIAEKIRDVVAWRQLRDNRHQQMPDINFGGLADIAYEDMDRNEREQALAILRKEVIVPSSLTNSAEYQCLMHMFLLAKGQGPSNTLDDAYRILVDPTHTKRKDHSAVEDIVMSAKVGMALLRELKGLPNIAKIYEAILRKADPECRVEVMEPREHRTKGEAFVEGDLRIIFSKPLEQLSERARKYWEFFSEFDEVVHRNERVPQHIISMDKKKQTVVLNAERSNPLTLNLLKKHMFYEQMLDSGKFEDITLFDSTGNRIDVTTAGAAAREERTVEDVHFGSLRKNLAYLLHHVDDLQSNLAFIRTARERSRKVGLCVFTRGQEGEGDSVTIRGHLRSFGDVTFRLPKGKSAGQCEKEIMENFDFLLNIGAIPGIKSSSVNSDPDAEDRKGGESDSAEATKDGRKNEKAFSKITIDMNQPDVISVMVTPMVMELLARRRGIRDIVKTDRPGWEPRTIGNVIVTRDGEGNFILSGKKIDFRDVVDSSRLILRNARISRGDEGARIVEPAQVGAATVEITEHKNITQPLSNLIRDASWLLYRFQRIPGTHHIKLEDGKVTLFQEDGVSQDAVELLYRCNIPFRADAKTITIDSDYLMGDAFEVSQQLSRKWDDMVANQEKLPDRREPTPLRIINMHRALNAVLDGAVKDMESADGDCWVTDGKRGTLGRPRRYHLDLDDNNFTLQKLPDGTIDLSRSSVAGPHRYDAHDMGSTINVQMKMVMAHAVLNNLRQQYHDTTASLTEHEGGIATLHVPAAGIARLKQSVQDCSKLLYAISKLAGANRLEAASMQLQPDTRMDVALPKIDVMNDKQYLADLIRLHERLNASRVKENINAVHKLFPDPATLNRRNSNVALLTGTLISDNASKELLQLERHMVEMVADIQGCGYGSRITKDIGSISTIIHELDCFLEAKASALQHGRLVDKAAIEKLHLTREKLGNAANALGRLEEAAQVVQKCISGDKGESVVRVIADAHLHHLDVYMQDAIGQPSITAAVQKYEDTIREALQKAHPKWTERRIYQTLSASYQKRAMELLMRMDKEPELNPLVERLLERANPQYNQEQRQSIINMYQYDGERHLLWRENTVQELARWFPRSKTDVIRQMVDTCVSLKNPDAEDVVKQEWAHESNDHIDRMIANAYEHRARQYLYVMADDTSYEKKARELFIKAGCDRTYIDKQVKNAKLRQSGPDATNPYADSTIERARTALRPHAVDGSLNDYLDYIDVDPAYEQLARELIRQRNEKEMDTRLETIGQSRPDPYADLKIRRKIINTITTLLDEVQDLKMVRYHCVKDLSETIALLSTDEHQLHEVKRLPGEVPVRTVGVSSDKGTELFGIENESMPMLYHLRDTLKGACGKKMEERLRALKVPVTESTHERIIFDVSEMLKNPAMWAPLLLDEKTVKPEVVVPDKYVPPAQSPIAASLADVLHGIQSLPVLAEVLHSSHAAISMGVSITLTPAQAGGDEVFRQIAGYLMSLHARQQEMPGFPKCLTSLDISDNTIQFSVNAEYMEPVSSALQLVQRLAQHGLSEGVSAGKMMHVVEITLQPVNAQTRDERYGQFSLLASGLGYRLPTIDQVYPENLLGKSHTIMLSRRFQAIEKSSASSRRSFNIENVTDDTRTVLQAMKDNGPEQETFAERRLREILDQPRPSGRASVK